MSADSEPVPHPRRARWLAGSRDRKRLSRFALTIAFACPLAVVTSFNGAWLLAWAVLGRRPIPSLDDPTAISPFVTVVYYASMLAVVESPVFAVLGIAATIWFARTHRVAGWAVPLLLLLLVGLWAGTITLLQNDPLEVNAWWFD